MKKEKEIIKFLKKRYNAKAIVITGSRAYGDYKPNSDWDIYVFTDKKYRKETDDEFYASFPDSLKGENLDLYKHYLGRKEYPDKMYRNFRYSKIVLDTKNGFAKKLKKRSQKIYSKKPKKWTKTYAQGRVYKAERYMKKFIDNYDDKKFGELYLRFCWHYTENVIDWWFGIRQEHKLRPQQTFPYIKKKDPKFYRQLKRVFDGCLGIRRR